MPAKGRILGDILIIFIPLNGYKVLVNITGTQVFFLYLEIIESSDCALIKVFISSNMSQKLNSGYIDIWGHLIGTLL